MRMDIVEVIEKPTFFKEFDNIVNGYRDCFWLFEFAINLVDHLPFLYPEILQFLWLLAFLYFLLFVKDIIVILQNLVMVYKWWFYIWMPIFEDYLFSCIFRYWILSLLYFRLNFFTFFIIVECLGLSHVCLLIFQTFSLLLSNCKIFLSLENFLMKNISCFFDLIKMGLLPGIQMMSIILDLF